MHRLRYIGIGRENTVHCFLINLDRQADRLAKMKREFEQKNLTFQRICAIDYQTLSQQTLEKSYDKKAAITQERELTCGEIACGLSHMACWQKIIDDDLTGAFIFEDDAVLMTDAPKAFEQIDFLHRNNEIPQDSVILFTHTPYYKKSNIERKLTKKTALYTSYGTPFAAYGYYISKTAAKNLLNTVEKSKLCFPIDHWWIWAEQSQITLQNTIPYCVRHNFDLHSNLDQERKIFRKNKKKKALAIRIKKILKKIVFQVVLRYVMGIKLQKNHHRESVKSVTK
jgi:glycosyl transferase, family 25